MQAFEPVLPESAPSLPLTSRERVRRVIQRHEPDRVPVDYLHNPGIDTRLKTAFGLPDDDTEGLLQHLGVDFRHTYPGYNGPRRHEPSATPGVETDPEYGQRRQWIENDSGGYLDFGEFPLADADDDAIVSWPMPSPDDYDYEAALEVCRLGGDRFVTTGGAGVVDVMNWTGTLMGVEQMMLAIAEEHDATLTLMDRKVDLQCAIVRRMFEASRGRIDMLWIGEDLGSQRGPLISPTTFDRLIRPRHERMIRVAQEFDVPVMIHSCGSSSWAFDAFVEMGITVIDTLQPEAEHMQPAYLKQRFGDRLAFHGCLSTAGPVAAGTVEETIEDTRSTLETMMPGGGYCASPTHRLQDNSPTENVLAMYRTIHRVGRYDTAQALLT